MNKLALCITIAATCLTACADNTTKSTEVAQSIGTHMDGAPLKSAQENVQSNSAQTPARAKGVWIDVRSHEEFVEGHLMDAVNVPHDTIAQQIESIEPNKDAPINLYCRSGRRAESAKAVLENLGYTNVTNHGGYDDLVKQGLQ